MEAGQGTSTVEVALDGTTVRWPFPPGTPTDLACVDALARLALAARRAGGELRVIGPPPPLNALLDLCGLSESAGGSIEVAGETEGLEQPVVEEAVVADDPIA
jgi:hypothetical protein